MDEQPAPGDFEKVAGLIRAIQVALLTTVDEAGRFHARPLQTLRIGPQRTLWFFTDWHSLKAAELHKDWRVGLTYANARAHTYVAISGIGVLVRDAEQARALWTIEQRAFYPEGPEDPRLAILRVTVEFAEYWIAPGRSSYLMAAAHAAMTGEPVQILGENKKLP
jgi:general stress protein 26